MQRNVIAALIIGMLIGAASATAISASPSPDKKAQYTTVWGEAHAAIPHDTVQPVPAPTF